MLRCKGITCELLLQTYLTAVGILTLNGIRTLGAHRFRHQGEELTFVDQLLDSVNYPRHPILWAAMRAPVCGIAFSCLASLVSVDAISLVGGSSRPFDARIAGRFALSSDGKPQSLGLAPRAAGAQRESGTASEPKVRMPMTSRHEFHICHSSFGFTSRSQVEHYDYRF